MRILFATTAGIGHFRPLLPFAAASAAAGHEVAVAAPRSFARQVAAAGHRHLPFDDVPPVTLAALHREAARDPGGTDRFAAELFGRLAAGAALPGLREAVETYRPALIVRDVAELGSLVAAASYGIPEIPLVGSLQDFARRLLADAVPLLAPLGLGFAPPDTPSLSLFPAAVDPAAQPPAVHRFRDGTAPARAVPVRPVVYLSYGTVAPGDTEGAAALRASADVLSGLPVDLVVSTGRSEPSIWRGVGRNVRARPWVDEDRVLARASAVVCHGGAGTTLAALRAGVPLVVVPRFGDQPAIAGAVAASGTGLRLPDGGAPKPDDLLEAAERVLGEPSFSERAAALAREIGALPPVAEAVPLFERLAA
ncbi:glycosyltransferase [Actinoplanes sp. NPDC051851]|uniref:glycosyltransferase n=1 Tax=Actinoplanes sp. NPDC051851 TaxID=3154753 RepID=UPI0034252221